MNDSLSSKLFNLSKNFAILVFGLAPLISIVTTSSCSQASKLDTSASSAGGIQATVAGNQQFALDLYNYLNTTENNNIFFSPYSISAALAMTYEGAKGPTATEIQSTLHFPNKETLRPNFAAIDNQINQNNRAYELNTANALWGQQGYPFNENYLNILKKYYGGQAKTLDFIKESEKSRQTINTYIAEQTHQKIQNLIPPGGVNELTRLVLTNAIYFKGNWQWEFDPAETQSLDFKINAEHSIKTPTMIMHPKKADFNYAETEDLEILELPYQGEKLSMLILLPKKDLSSLGTLSLEKLHAYQKQMRISHLDLILLPKFEFKSHYLMQKTLSDLGIPTAFDIEKADFSEMSSQDKLSISDVIHQAYVKVDEKGTEAAAATAVTFEVTAMQPAKVFNADHPFIFIIQEKNNGNILFMGKVMDPSQK